MIKLDGWALVPGPTMLPAPKGWDLRNDLDLIMIPPDAVASAILEFPGMKSDMRIGHTSWYDWRASWQKDGSTIKVCEITLFEPDDAPIAWGGSSLRGACELESFLAFWEWLRLLHPSIWMMHEGGDCRLPEEFRQFIEDARGDA